MRRARVLLTTLVLTLALASPGIASAPAGRAAAAAPMGRSVSTPMVVCNPAWGQIVIPICI